MPDLNLGVLEMIRSHQDSNHRAIIRFVFPDFSFGLFLKPFGSSRLMPKNTLRKAVEFAEVQKRAKRDAKLLQTRCQDDLDFFLGTSKGTRATR